MSKKKWRGEKKRSSAVCVHPAVIIIDNISPVTIDDVLMLLSTATAQNKILNIKYLILSGSNLISVHFCLFFFQIPLTVIK